MKKIIKFIKKQHRCIQIRRRLVELENIKCLLLAERKKVIEDIYSDYNLRNRLEIVLEELQTYTYMLNVQLIQEECR